MAENTKFFSITLDSKSKEYSFDPDIEIGDQDTSTAGLSAKHSLVVKLALLGQTAEKGDINVIQVEAIGHNGEQVITPVAVLEHGHWQTRLGLTFPDAPVTFTLIKGKGPVHIVGNSFSQFEDESEEADEEEEDDLSEGELEQIRKAQEGIKTLANKRKLNEDQDDIDEDDDEPKEKEAKKNGKSPKVEEKKKPAAKKAK